MSVAFVATRAVRRPPRPQPVEKAAPDWRRIHQAADQLTPELRRAFLRMVELLREHLDPTRLIELLHRGDAGQLGAFWQAFEAELTPALRPTIRAAFLDAAEATARRLQTSFDLTNPRAIRAIEEQSLRMVRNLTLESAQAIRTVLRVGFEGGLDVRQMAQRIRHAIGLTERGVRAVEHFRQNLLREGVAPSRARERAMAYEDRLVRDRAMVIARTETIAAANRGQQAVWETATAEGLVPGTARRVWIITPDDRLCPICEEIPDLNPDGVGLAQPFRTSAGLVMTPPAHPQCRCAMGLEFPEGSVP